MTLLMVERIEIKDNIALFSKYGQLNWYCVVLESYPPCLLSPRKDVSIPYILSSSITGQIYAKKIGQP